ncbi:T9SS type A sorting domain-containing protein [Gilvibacter sediminis]|uniref:T9SS type A sorting domain-containing protein n=1 Tax=Gilvibacter sediminis TaxID=379071 RepID=UPI002350F777|nr:T9SS type A sorting domain-containing protein [Gilvibacter sediminis]MDC7996691.1 T9SS type A sorting domain-containing protein [Gilvibacter sediminis]
MKKRLLFLFAFGCLQTTFSQIGPEQIISTNADRAMGVFAADLDGDGDQDVLSASRFDHKLAWYENVDGFGNFGSEIVITDTFFGAWAVIAADINGDGAQDIVALANDINEVAWFENLDGSGSFGPRQIISSAFTPNALYVADFDGDDDLDVVFSSVTDGRILKIENLDGLGNFGPPEVALNLFAAYGVFLGDLDGDDDLDLIATSYSDGFVVWQENLDGLGDFGPAQIIVTDENGASDVFAIDIDGDDDLDVVSSSALDSQIAWYENIDGLGAFGPQQLLSPSALDAWSVYPTDLDEDGDIDILATSGLADNKVSWFENLDGLGDFGPETVITSNALEARKVYAADLDGDGDMDVLSASRGDDKIAWYENLTILSVVDNARFDLAVYPNPTQDYITLNMPDYVSINTADVFNLLGQKMETSLQNLTVDLTALAPGVYYLLLETDHGSSSQRIIKR